MGCDIHMYSETRVEGTWVCDQRDSFRPSNEVDNSSWLDMEDLGVSRNYSLFGLLADVRREHPSNFPVLGFPEDASVEVTTMYKQWAMDAHTPSYISLKELKQKAAQLLIENDGVGHALNEQVIQALPQTTDNSEDKRIVFWFDN